MTISIFLSYAREDTNAAQNIYQALQERGFVPWLSEFDILPGQEWRETIVQQIHNANIVLICLSHNSVDKRGFFQKEIKIALDVCDELPEGDIFIIPVRLENIAIPEKLRKFQWVDIFEPDGFDKLITSLFYQQDKTDKFLQQKPFILLDFKTITNPVSLLQCLIIFRNTHQAIFVGEHNLNAIEWLDEPGGPTPMHINLLDHGYLRHLESYHGYPYENLEFSKLNYSLALRILRFAIDEQFIKIEKSSDNLLLSKLKTVGFDGRNYYADFHNLAEQLARTLQTFDNEINDNEQLKVLKPKIRTVLPMNSGKSTSRAWDGGFLLTPCYMSATWYSKFYDAGWFDPYDSNQRYDLSLSLKKNYHMAIDGNLSSFPTNYVFNEMINLHSSLYQETITSIAPENFYEYQKIIEIAGLFSEISSEITKDMPQKMSIKQFHWFNPWLNQISNSKTGSSSLAKVLYSTIKREIQRTKRS